MKKILTILTFSLLVLSNSYAGDSIKDIKEKRAKIIDNNSKILQEIYKEKPDVESQVNAAPGYATFDSSSIIIGLGGGVGQGVLVNNQTNTKTFMNMAEVKAGVGLGIKKFRALLIFHDKKTMDNFIKHGWTAGAGVSADAVAKDKGGSTSGDVKVNNISIYQLTKTGLALEASVSGTKFWVSNKLN